MVAWGGIDKLESAIVDAGFPVAAVQKLSDGARIHRVSSADCERVAHLIRLGLASEKAQKPDA